MQRCGNSHSNTMRRCPCNNPFHTRPDSFSMLLSVPFDNEPLSTTVDCTLSLGTPSTRLSRDNEKRSTNRACVSNFCWDLLHAQFQPPVFPQNSYNIGRDHGFNCGNGDSGDPLLARRCANCDTTSTPLWRNGPRGPKSLCNACGIRFKKEERRAAECESAPIAAAKQHAWVPLSQPQKLPCFSPAIGEDSSASIPFLSWRLNVTDRPSLVHDFTR